MKVSLLYIGKTRDKHANAMAEEYVKRSKRFGSCEMREIRPEREDAWNKAGATTVLLSPEGKLWETADVVRLFETSRMEGKNIVFLIGGTEGHPKEWKQRSDMLVSLSRMTFPHELARVLVAEQIYRAFATLAGHPYPR
jgi:23S rRNA (pseudouridine1915-N3)-methyltransferase